MAELRLPARSLVVLVGPAGAGKTTFAGRHFPPSAVVSSDRCRELIAGDAGDQTVNRAAFRMLDQEVRRRLREGRPAIVDATNLQARSRRRLLALAAAAGVSAVAIVLAPSLELCLARNRARAGRPVPEAVVRRQHARLGPALAVIEAEGFSRVAVLRTPAEVGRASVRLTPD